jgi:hypothetical protein
MRKSIIALLSAVVLSLGGAFIYYFGPGGDGVIGRLTLGDGSDFKVIQRYNHWFAEPYSIDFYFKLPGATWGWCYVEHEDTRWRAAQVRYNPQNHSIEVYRGKTLRAAYFIDRKTFALYADWQRELAAPQELRDPPL